MKVMNVSGACQHAPIFQRRLRENEKSEYRNNTLQEAFDFLGVRELAMIMHGSCFPVVNTDFGVGSPFSKAAEDVIKVEMLHGFNNNQLGPSGKISKANISPYKSSVWEKNELFIDLNELKKDKYANILSDEMTGGLLNTLSVKYPSNGKNYVYSKFYDAFGNYDKALNVAYNNFLQKVAKNDSNALKLNNEFNEYKMSNKNKLIKQGLFQVLRKTYGTGDFRQWENPIDKNLVSLLKDKDPRAIERYKYLSKKFNKDINVYSFEQFIAEKQIDENKKFRKEHNFKYINDLLVGFSNSDEWINQEAFLPNWKMGCPYGGPYGAQTWGVPVLDPNKLFNDDGTLGVAGKLLQKKIFTALEDCENVRIDHALGLVDPYVYDERTIEIVDNHYTNKFRGGNISKLGLDKEGHYKQILEKIILPALEAQGLKPEDAVWEDVCTGTKVWGEIYYNKHHLPGLTQLEFKRSEGSSRKNWSLLGGHDSAPALKLLNENDWVRKHEAWDSQYLAGFLHWDAYERGAERDAFCRKISENNLDRVKAKFAELFMNSEKIQVSFADFFGLDKVYNYGGKDDIKTNWKLRLSKDYEDQYYKNLTSDNPTALNLPEILTIAVKAHMDRLYINYLNKRKEDIKQYEGNKDLYNEKLQPIIEDSLNYKKELKTKMQPLLERLDKFTNILKEKE